MKYNLHLILLSILISCSFANNTENDNSKYSKVKNGSNNIFPITKTSEDSLISKLAEMKTDTLDCSAKTYWKIIGKGKEYIPKLIEALVDTTSTNIYNGCKSKKLNIGEVSYLALQNMCEFPPSQITQIQFDVFYEKNGWNCWSFHNYLFEDKNKFYFQSKMKYYYENSIFTYKEYADNDKSSCMKEYSINGAYIWKKYKEHKMAFKAK